MIYGKCGDSDIYKIPIVTDTDIPAGTLELQKRNQDRTMELRNFGIKMKLAIEQNHGGIRTLIESLLEK